MTLTNSTANIELAAVSPDVVYHGQLVPHLQCQPVHNITCEATLSSILSVISSISLSYAERKYRLVEEAVLGGTLAHINAEQAYSILELFLPFGRQRVLEAIISILIHPISVDDAVRLLELFIIVPIKISALLVLKDVICPDDLPMVISRVFVQAEDQLRAQAALSATDENASSARPVSPVRVDSTVSELELPMYTDLFLSDLEDGRSSDSDHGEDGDNVLLQQTAEATDEESDEAEQDNKRFLGAILSSAECDMCGYVHPPCAHHDYFCTCNCTDPAATLEAAMKSRILLEDGRGLTSALKSTSALHRTFPFVHSEPSTLAAAHVARSTFPGGVRRGVMSTVTQICRWLLRR